MFAATAKLSHQLMCIRLD